MSKPTRTSPLGSQLWVEPDDSPARIRSLIQSAAETQLGLLRIFLLWTRIERTPGVWNFEVYDTLFDIAAEYGIGIKATLTANSGPWHIGTPCALHSHTGFLAESQDEPMRRYIRACVLRYREHPALAQWLLWNEPHAGFKEHLPSNLPSWRSWLRERYHGEIEKLNERWLTGFCEFNEIPWPEELLHELHRGGSWSPYAPRLDEMNWRAARLVEQVGWVAKQVREYDAITEIGINPIFTIENQAGGGTDVRALAGVVDRLGSSYHPVFWHEKVSRVEYPGLIGAGVLALAAAAGGKPIELTEVVSGNCLNSGSRACAVGPYEIARFYLAAFACGAETVTGWCLNARPRDSEAGEFSLLDDNDGLSERSRGLAKLASVLEMCRHECGDWSLTSPQLLLATSRRSQAIELLDSELSSENPKRPGRGPQDSARGIWMLAQRALEVGVVAMPADLLATTEFAAAGRVLFVSHLTAWEREEAEAIEHWVSQGGTVVLDGLCGRKDHDSNRHLPWPGHLADVFGLEVREVETAANEFDLIEEGEATGVGTVFRTSPRFSEAWTAASDLRFADDHSPALFRRRTNEGELFYCHSSALFRRRTNEGEIFYCRFPVAPTLLGHPSRRGWLRRLIRVIVPNSETELTIAGNTPGAITIPIKTPHGSLTAVLAPERASRGGAFLRLRAHRPGNWFDYWTQSKLEPTALRDLSIPCEEGIALLRRLH